MTRLFDDVSWFIDEKWTRKRREEATIVDISNVAEYWSESNKDFTADDMPFSVPPFKLGFYQLRVPARLFPQKKEDNAGAWQYLGKPVGLWVGVIDITDEEAHKNGEVSYIEHHLQDFAKKAEKASENDRRATQGALEAIADSRWIAVATALSAQDNKEVEILTGMIFGISYQGVASGKTIVNLFNDADLSISYAMFFSQVLRLSWSFMNCKNVARVEHEAPTKVNQRRIKEGKEPFKKYYTLNIEPIARVLDKEGDAKHNGVQKAMHICRGHFATYDEKPLFGKIKGTFWIPQHVKGNKTIGTIKKDYNVKTVSD